MKNSKLKFLLLSDIVGSRKIKERKKFEKRLEIILQQVSAQYGDAFELPIRVWKGLDEMAAVIGKPWLLYNIMDAIASGIVPYQVRFVLVKGRVELLSEDKDVAKADGEAFPAAVAQMNMLKKEGLYFTCDTGNSLFDQAWKTQVNLIRLIKKDWTEQQWLIYESYKSLASQEAVGKKLKITQQSVSKALRSIDAVQMIAIEKELESWTMAELNKK